MGRSRSDLPFLEFSRFTPATFVLSGPKALSVRGLAYACNLLDNA